MVKKTELEKALMFAINEAKEKVEKQFGITLNIDVNWTLGKGHYFEDGSRNGIGG